MKDVQKVEKMVLVELRGLSAQTVTDIDLLISSKAAFAETPPAASIIPKLRYKICLTYSINFSKFFSMGKKWLPDRQVMPTITCILYAHCCESDTKTMPALTPELNIQ
uniref:Uncharacterized protein n=1 Tax=Romanomermis culicivorax TaxID=13658 RepID=A0A915IIV5_ROMCU